MRPRRLCLLLLSNLCALCGCGTARVRMRGPVLTPAQMANAATLKQDSAQSGFLRRIGTFGMEDVPYGLDREAVVDNVDVASVEGERICFDVTMRTSTVIDRPLATWTFRIGHADGIAHETSSHTRSYPTTSEQTTMWFRSSFGGFRVREPVDGSFDVVTRKGSVCGYLPPDRPHVVDFYAKIPGDLPMYDFYQHYFFTLVP